MTRLAERPVAMGNDGDTRLQVGWPGLEYQCPQCKTVVVIEAIVHVRLEMSLDANRAWFHGEGPN